MFYGLTAYIVKKIFSIWDISLCTNSIIIHHPITFEQSFICIQETICIYIAMLTSFILRIALLFLIYRGSCHFLPHKKSHTKYAFQQNDKILWMYEKCFAVKEVWIIVYDTYCNQEHQRNSIRNLYIKLQNFLDK